MEDVRKALGRRIRELRGLRRMTQQQLGEKADLNYKYLGAIERGQKNPATDNLSKIASALGVEVGDLFTVEEEIEDPKAFKEKVEALLKDATEKEYKTILKVIKAILG
jgi:transcriptional regulator with XRE-family HTH domain